MFRNTFIIIPVMLTQWAYAQLSGSVGPTSTFVHKADIMICDVTDYGATSSADFGAAFTSAWNACAASGNGGLVYVPPGEYPLKTGVSVKDADNMAVQFDGTVYRDAELTSDYFFAFNNLQNFELFSGNSKGAIQGYGYEYLENGDYGARLLLIQDTNNASLHGLTLVDSPSYYVKIGSCESMEIYNMRVYGVTTLGETDAFDVSGSNIWVHDVEVTNGDECVTVKSPANNFLFESIYCNLSGGTAIGSLGLSTSVKDISYKNLYMNNADACFLKTHGGSGTVSSVTWDTVYIHGGAYVLAIDESWGDYDGGLGVEVSDLTFKNWYGYNSDNSRPTIRLECNASVPCTDVVLDNINLWTEDGDYVKWECENVYGSGYCIESKSTGAYTTVETVSTVAYKLPGTMAGDLTAALSPTASFTIPAMPTSFFPGLKPYSTLLSYTGAADYTAVQGRAEPQPARETNGAEVVGADLLAPRVTTFPAAQKREGFAGRRVAMVVA